MTPTERARRSDALYYDTESVARRCLCDMIANRESDLEDARAENASLKNEVKLLRAICAQVRLEGQSFKTENAKLRERVDELEELLPDSGRWYRAETVEAYVAEIAKLRELVSQMYRDMQGVLDMSTDTVFVDSIGTLRDVMDLHMQAMAELGMPPMDYEDRMRELGVEVE